MKRDPALCVVGERDSLVDLFSIDDRKQIEYHGDTYIVDYTQLKRVRPTGIGTADWTVEVLFDGLVIRNLFIIDDKLYAASRTFVWEVRV